MNEARDESKPEPDLVLRLADGVSMGFRWIVRLGETSEFRMGSRGESPREEPRHRVRLTIPYLLEEYPVTQAQFAVWRPEHENLCAGKPDHPAENMTWLDANGFCKWFTSAFAGQFPEGIHFACLPTEAEWECACRAGTETDYYTGEREAALAEAGWFDEDWDSGSTHPVGGKRPNELHLFDMHGNVWEWCHDEFNEETYRLRPDDVVNPGATARIEDIDSQRNHQTNPHSNRVRRGGSWDNSAWVCRSAVCIRGAAGFRNRFGGFRVCLVPGPVLNPTFATQGGIHLF